MNNNIWTTYYFMAFVLGIREIHSYAIIPSFLGEALDSIEAPST